MLVSSMLNAPLFGDDLTGTGSQLIVDLGWCCVFLAVYVASFKLVLLVGPGVVVGVSN